MVDKIKENLLKELKEVEDNANKDKKACFTYYKQGDNLSDNLVNPHESKKAKIIENKIEQHEETKKYIISLIKELLPKYYEDGADEFAGQLEFAILGVDEA